MTKISDNVTKGVEKSPMRSLFYAMGYTKEELERPLIGVVSAHSEIVPGHIHLDKITEAVKAGVRMAGGTPIMVPAIGVCDGIAMEIIKELPLVDAILIPVGGGGLATGVSTLAKLLKPNVQIIAVEPAGANSLQRSLEAGEVRTMEHIQTIADGTAVKTPGESIFPYLQKNVDRVITVEDDELVVAFLDMVENHKMVVENSGLLTVAALKHLDFKEKKVVSILSGGNTDIITISNIIQNGLIMRDRIFTVSVMLPDKPGELVRVAQTIADAQGNVVKLEHNQFVSVDRNHKVELKVTIEAFGTEHKQKIINALKAHGFDETVETGIMM